MGIQKAEIKMAVAHEIGCSIDDVLESTKADVLRWDGCKQAHKQTADGLNGIAAFLKKDLEEGKLSIEEAELVQRWLKKTQGLVDNLALTSDIMLNKTRGKVEGLEKVVLITKKVFDAEERKLTALQEPDEEDDTGRPAARATGRHPGNSEAQERRASAKPKAKPAKAAKKTRQTKKKSSKKKS